MAYEPLAKDQIEAIREYVTSPPASSIAQRLIATIDARDAEIAQLRADLARVTAELDEAIEDRRQARDDAARAAALLAVRTMERDARPEISREDAERIVSWMHATILENADSAVNPPPWVYRLREALRALTAGSGKAEASEPVSDLVAAYERARVRALAESIKDEASGGVCDACNDAGTVVVHGKEEQWDEPCPACNGRKGGADA